MSKQYWVVGGDFTSLNFHSFVPGTTEVWGPIKTREQAEDEWRRWSEWHRSSATRRYIILEEPIK
jgi:hypothetical protein